MSPSLRTAVAVLALTVAAASTTAHAEPAPPLNLNAPGYRSSGLSDPTVATLPGDTDRWNTTKVVVGSVAAGAVATAATVGLVYILLPIASVVFDKH